MKHVRFLLPALLVAFGADAFAQDKPIPEVLQPWEGWATWNDEHRLCPTPYSDPKKHLCFWPSRLGLQVDANGGKFDVVVTVFHEAWVPLPGSAELWPMDVRTNGAPIAVVEHEGKPAVRLGQGTVHLEGAYRWNAVPQRIPIPPQIGILALIIDGQPVDAPVWDAEGFLWLKRDGSTEETDKDFLAVKLYAALEDGIPLWLRTEIELTVSGKSREEDLGTVLPEGWKLAAVEGPIPVSIDDAGRMKAQVRAGKWTVRLDAFRFDNPKEVRYAEGAKPAVEEELIAFHAQPEFRIVEIVGPPSIDVSQTTFPDQWRALPVYRWDTSVPIQIEERMRGMGDQKPAGLAIGREWWLDEDGGGFTFRDQISGAMQQIWRLDAAAGEDLGSVRSGGEGQLITLNPQNNAPGVEIRTRNLDLEATGRMPRAGELPATGWRTDADALRVTLNLPPGWRLFALFGADWVSGDWLTAWTLLDLFLLLIFSLAVFRLWGIRAAVLAFVAFGLSYHEVGAPRYLWLILLVPLALQRVVPAGWGRRLLAIGKWLAVAAFVLALVPFIARQVQQALYPQLEVVGQVGGFLYPMEQRADAQSVDFDANVNANAATEPPQADVPPPPPGAPVAPSPNRYATTGSAKPMQKSAGAKGNLLYDASARIQTGPGVPEWNWRTVSFGWNGPVTAAQHVNPVLISVTLERVLTVLRITLLLALAAVLLGVRKISGTVFHPKAKATVAAIIAFGCLLANASAQTAVPPSVESPTVAARQDAAPVFSIPTPIPDQATLDKLRERLLEPSDAYPTAADIPSVSLTLTDRKLVIEAEIHAAIRTGVPLPGRLPAWSPVSVFVDDKPEVALRRDDGYLWLVIEPGVHHVRVEGSLANVTEWEWSFLLKPHQVKIDAPEWTVSGLKPDGVPEAQVFFARKEKAGGGAASYERQEVQTVALVDRHLELGLIWQVHTTVTRLSPAGKAIVLRVPLLPGENVLSSNAVVNNGAIEVRLGAQDESFTWEGGLEIANEIKLATRADDTWVERWYLVASPVWNVEISGLAPVFEPGDPDLVPLWQPWPGETVALAVSRPEAIAGATVTVSRGTHDVSLGKRQRTSTLALSLRCSLGEDFLVELPANAEITSLAHDGKAIPVRQDGSKLIIPVRPGEQTVSIGWKTNVELGFRAQAGEVRLPVESANIQTSISVPEDRWVLWTHGPLRGPAVRFWGILICSLLAAFALGRMTLSPIHALEWMMLVIGLTQVPLPAALTVVGWHFFLAWRRTESFQHLGNTIYNILQAFLIVLTAIVLGILIMAVGEGLLGRPEMFITGNGSSASTLVWFQARCGELLPHPGCISISIWWYRFFMLVWALWLALALIRWLRTGWQSFGSGGFFHQKPKAEPTPPPPLPAQG